jgi:hypothetical protein
MYLAVKYNYEYLQILDSMYDKQYLRDEYINQLQHDIDSVSNNLNYNSMTHVDRFRSRVYCERLTVLQKELASNILQRNFVHNLYITNLNIYSKKFNKAKIIKHILLLKQPFINKYLINNIISFY